MSLGPVPDHIANGPQLHVNWNIIGKPAKPRVRRHDPWPATDPMILCGLAAHEGNWTPQRCAAEIRRRAVAAHPTRRSMAPIFSDWKVFCDPDVRPHILTIYRRVTKTHIPMGDTQRARLLLMEAGRLVRDEGIAALANWAPT